MKPSKRVMRQRVLARMYEHLQMQYGIGFSRNIFVRGQLTTHELDALLAFKSDPRLDELRYALDRIEDGSYGVCLMCKGTITEETLNADPAQRLCMTCERTAFHTPVHQFAPLASA